MIEPALADDALLADVARAPVSAVHLWWLGQSGFLIKHRGRFLLVDPYLSNSLTRKYDRSDRPHVQMTRRVVDPKRLPFVDVVTASHSHTDHLDPDTLRALAAAAPRLQLACPAEIVALARERSGIEPTALRDGEQVRLRGFGLERVPAAHEELSGDFAGLVLTLGRHRVYHAGDTIWHDAIVECLRPMEVSVALLPINGRAPGRGVAGNLDGREAARLAHAIGAHIAVPMHFDMFEFNTATPEAFVEEAARLGQDVVVLRAGERLTLATP